MTKQEQLINDQLDDLAASWFLEYTNDYLTVAKFAADKNVSVKTATTLIIDGKRIHNERCE